MTGGDTAARHDQRSYQPGRVLGRADIAPAASAKSRLAQIPAVRIAVAPAYVYHGVMLDAARYFFPVGFIKRRLDLYGYYKKT